MTWMTWASMEALLPVFNGDQKMEQHLLCREDERREQSQGCSWALLVTLPEV